MWNTDEDIMKHFDFSQYIISVFHNVFVNVELIKKEYVDILDGIG